MQHLFFSCPHFGAGLTVHRLLHLEQLLTNAASTVLGPQHVDCPLVHAG